MDEAWAALRGAEWAAAHDAFAARLREDPEDPEALAWGEAASGARGTRRVADPPIRRAMRTAARPAPPRRPRGWGNAPGEGAVVQETGRIVMTLDTHEAFFVAGPHPAFFNRGIDPAVFGYLAQ